MDVYNITNPPGGGGGGEEFDDKINSKLSMYVKMP